MTPWTADLDQYDTWEELEDHLAWSSHMVTVIAGRDGPVVCLDVSGWRGGVVRVTDPRQQLRAQDRRRLHRLGLRAPADTPAETVARSWTWESSPVDLAPGRRLGELVLAGVLARPEVERVCRAQLVTVLRDGLRLELSQLTVLPMEEEDPVEEEPEDEDWVDTWGDDA